MVCVVWLLAVVLTGVESCVTIDSGEEGIDYVSSLLHHLLNATMQDCTFVLLHSLPQVPQSILKGLTTLPGSTALVSIYWPSGSPVEELDANSTIMIRDNPWPYYTDRQTVLDQCAVYAILLHRGEDLNPMMTFLRTIIPPKPTRDHILLWNQDGSTSPEELLLHSPIVSKYKFKLLVSTAQEKVQLLTACFYCNNGSADIIQLNHKNFFTSTMADLFPDFTRNLNGTFLKGVYVYPSSPKGLMKMRKNGDVVDIGNVNAELLRYALNFDWEVYQSEIGESGAVEQQLDDGSWVGFVADVLYDKVDFGLSTIMSAEVANIVDLSIPFYITEMTFATAQARPIFSWKILAYPFTKYMWLLIVLSTIVSSIILWIILLAGNDTRDLFKSKCDMFGYCFMYLSVSLIGCPPPYTPTSHAVRVFISLWLCYALIVSVSYQSKLVAFMSVAETEIIPETFLEVVDMKYRYGGDAKHIAYFQFLLQTIEVEKIQFLRDTLEGFENSFECLEIALESRLACITAVDYLDTEMQKLLDHNGHLQHVLRLQAGFSIMGAMIFKKNYHLTKSIDDFIGRNAQSGLLDKSLKDMSYTGFLRGLRKLRQGNTPPTGGPTALKIVQLQGPLFLLLFGLFVGFILFTGEKFSCNNNC